MQSERMVSSNLKVYVWNVGGRFLASKNRIGMLGHIDISNFTDNYRSHCFQRHHEPKKPYKSNVAKMACVDLSFYM